MQLPQRYLELKDKDYDTLSDADKLFVLNWRNHERVFGLRNDQDARLNAVTKQVVNALDPVIRAPADPANPPDDGGYTDPQVLTPNAKKPEKRRKQKNLRPPVKG